MKINLKQIIFLLTVKLKTLVNGFIKTPQKKRFRAILSLAGGGVLFFFIYSWIFKIFLAMSNIPAGGNQLMDNIVIMAFLGFFIFLLVSGITISLHYLFISSDLPLLMVSPLSNDTIFTFKLIEAVFANSTFFFFMGIPIFLAYGITNQAHWFYYPMVLINAIIFLAIPVSISFLAALLIVRIIPPARAKEFMAILLGIVSLGIWLVLQVVRASTFDRTSADYSPQTLESLQQVSHQRLFDLLPSTWAARSLTGFAHADIKLILFNFLPLTIFMVTIFLICIQLSKNVFNQGFEQSVTLVRKNKRHQRRAKELPVSNRFFTSPSASIFLRDFRLTIRDTRQFVNILMFAAMMVILPLLQKPETFDSELSLYFPYFFLIFFSAIIAGQISARLIPIEGKSFWITKLLPQPSYKLILGKFLLGFSMSVIASWVAIIIISVYFHHPPRILMLAMITAFCLSGAISSLGILLASYFSRFDWDHPKRMLSQAGGLLLSLLSLLTVALIGGIIAIIFVLGRQFQLAQQLVDLTVVIVLIILSSIIILITMAMSARKLDRMEWQF